MKKDKNLTQQDFDVLLGWLSADRDEAGVLYEKIRLGLIKFFRFRGCLDPQMLADDTINRVAVRIPSFDTSKNVKAVTYFYGFASKVFLEYLRSVQTREISLDTENFPKPQSFWSKNDAAEVEHLCLEDCLSKLSTEDNRLVVDYYCKEKDEKNQVREGLARTLNLKMPALHTKVFRLRSVLRDCIEKCLEKKSL